MSTIPEIKVIYHGPKGPRQKITKAEQAYFVFIRSWNMDTIDLLEESKLLLLNRNNQILGIFHLSSGGVTGTVIDPKIVFAVSLKCNASSIILAHNHPSSNLQPSDTDVRITKRLKEIGDILDLNLLDHLILTKENFYSMHDNGDF